MHTSVPPFEEVRGASVRTPVQTGQMYEPDLGGKGYNIFGLREYYPLTPRPIPQMETGEPHPFTVLRRGDGWMELDAGAYTTAKVSFGFTAAAGACVKIIYAECVSVADAEGNRHKELRDAWDDPTARMEGVYDTVYATGERQSFSPFRYRAFRFVRLEFPADAGFEPDVMTLPLLLSNGRHGQLFLLGRAAQPDVGYQPEHGAVLHARMYVDCPYYEQQQYDMDSCPEMLFTFRDLRCTDAAQESTDLAHSQMADGMPRRTILPPGYRSSRISRCSGADAAGIPALRGNRRGGVRTGARVDRHDG